MIVLRAWLCSACVLLGACAGDGSGLDENGRPIGEEAQALQPTLASIQSNVFTPICSPCHAGASAPVGLRLEEGVSYAMLVNAPSVEAPTLLRAAPGDPDASYLVQKIEGAAAVGGRMPLNGPPLSTEAVAAIRQWITDGAAASSASGIATEQTVVVSALLPSADAALTSPPTEILMSANSALDVNLLNAGVVRLRASGGDGDFSDGDEIELPAVAAIRSLDPTVFTIQAPSFVWASDRYELRLSGGAPLALADLEARPIDGDRDGVAGGDFVLRFELEATR
jgi:hypothetical protein